MDASTYLKRRKAAMTTYVRQVPFVDAGLLTKKKALVVNTYVSPATTQHTVTPIPNPGFADAIPIYTPGCASSICSERPGLIVVPSVPMEYNISSIRVPPCVYSYQATPNQQAAASALATNKIVCPC